MVPVLKTMPKFIALSAVALLILSGCSASRPPGNSSEESTKSEELLPAAEGKTQYPLTITSALGEITIDKRPKRIAIPDAVDLDVLAALGVTPVGTSATGFYPTAVDALPADIATIFDTSDEDMPVEQIANTDPDLIVALTTAEAPGLGKVSSIAPVLGAPKESGANATWQERMRLFAKALDLSGRAEQFIDKYDASFVEIRAKHPEFQKLSVDCIVFWGGQSGAAYLSATGTDPETFFTQDLGFKSSPSAERFVADGGISDELTGTLQGDILVISDQSAASDAQAEYEAWFASPLTQGLRSVQAQRVIPIAQVYTEIQKGGYTDYEFEQYFKGEKVTAFQGHFGRSFSVGPLTKLALAKLLVPLLADVAK